jgi:hypothetical protein
VKFQRIESGWTENHLNNRIVNGEPKYETPPGHIG